MPSEISRHDDRDGEGKGDEAARLLIEHGAAAGSSLRPSATPAPFPGIAP
jgi:hypothetical protein